MPDTIGDDLQAPEHGSSAKLRARLKMLICVPSDMEKTTLSGQPRFAYLSEVVNGDNCFF